ncbi:protein tyrosine phosphatase [Agrococcus citreus]|uniref:Phosphotyrosine protein phosphatase I domain-containing protein n=1 Tax=Agrococcus citreus TaxID=84643 RepID=A0ABN1YND0_9MICO
MNDHRSGAILVVCAANVCRSPMAELTLRQAFAAMPGFERISVASAGVSAAADQQLCRGVLAVQGDPRWRALASAHRSRRLESREVEAATLVLTASRAIRAAVVAAAPECRRRVFTLREAVWLGAGFERGVDAGAVDERGADAVDSFWAHIDGSRGLRQLPVAPPRPPWRRRPPDPLDIVDGHGARTASHRRTVRDVEESARALAALIGTRRAS